MAHGQDAVGTGTIFDAAPDAPDAQQAGAAQEGVSADPTAPPTSVVDAARAEISADAAAHIDAIENIFSQIFLAGNEYE